MDENQARLAVVIPTRERSEMLATALEGVFAQEGVHGAVEVIVVDDSPHGSLDLPSDARILRSRGAGLNAARNLAIRESDAGLFCFLDDDVEVPSGWLAAMERAWASSPGPVCLAGRIRLRLEATGPRLCERCAQRPLATTLDLEGGAEAEWAWGANLAVSRSAIELVGPFDETLRVGGDEVEWQQRFKRAGGKILYVHDGSIWHRRLAEDLKITSLLRANFRRGRNNAFTQARTGRLKHNPWRALLASCGHALVGRCWGGLLRASNLAGHEIGRVEGKRSLR